MSSPAVSLSRVPDAPVSPTEVDASFRWVALFLVGKSAFWLVVGAFLSLLASVKLHSPGMMSSAPWLTYGRLLPAGWDVLVYGFAGQAGFALGLWVLARAAGQRLQAPILVLAGGVCWNLGVLAGLVGILAGYSTGREWLEMPAGAMAVLVVGAGLIGTAGWLTFAVRTTADTYPSAWFALLALLSFVWFGTVALMTLSDGSTAGVVQVLVQRWYAGGVMKLWLGGLALAVIFHFLPQAAGRPLASRSLAVGGFWALAFFAPWSVTAHGDPFPRWVVSAGVAGQILSTIGWLAIVWNWWKTVEGAGGRIWAGRWGRLVLASAVAYFLAGACQLAMALHGPSARFGWTWMQAGLEWLMVGGVAMVAFLGLLPVFLEHTTGRKLPTTLVGAHAWLSLVGLAVIAIALMLAGVAQGMALADETRPFTEVMRGSMNFVRLSSLGFTVFLMAQLVWVWALAGVVRSLATEALASMRQWSAPLAGKGAARG